MIHLDYFDWFVVEIYFIIHLNLLLKKVGKKSSWSPEYIDSLIIILCNHLNKKKSA